MELCTNSNDFEGQYSDKAIPNPIRQINFMDCGADHDINDDPAVKAYNELTRS